MRMNEQPSFEGVGKKRVDLFFYLFEGTLSLHAALPLLILKPFKTVYNEEGLVLMLAALKNHKAYLCLLKPLPTKNALV